MACRIDKSSLQTTDGIKPQHRSLTPEEMRVLYKQIQEREAQTLSSLVGDQGNGLNGGVIAVLFEGCFICRKPIWEK